MQLRVFVLGLGAILFLAGCSDEQPYTVVDSSDIDAIRKYEADQKAMEASMLEAAEEGEEEE